MQIGIRIELLTNVLILSDRCSKPLEVVKSVAPNIVTVQLMIGKNMFDDWENSILMIPDDQISYACKLIGADPRLQNGYNAIGLSQGGLLMRGVAERCPHPPVRNLITFGSPHQGIYGIPWCKVIIKSAFVCGLLRRFLSKNVYTQLVQGKLILSCIRMLENTIRFISKHCCLTLDRS